MDIKCFRDDLYSGVQSVERIVSTRSTLPIVGNVLFETVKEGIKISANNLEMGIEINIPATIKTEGAALIPAKTFANMVSKLPSTDISIKRDDKGIVKVSYKKSRFNINSMSADEFPLLPKLKETKTISISTKTFTEMAKQTIFSVSASEDKYVLNGVLFETGKNAQGKGSSNIRMVATDGFRLASRGETVQGITENLSVIVPAKALSEVMKIIQGGEDGDLKINMSSEQISFRHKNSYLVSRLIQGQFPDYKQVIPKSGETKITVDTKPFLESSERAAVIAGGSSNIIKLKVEEGSLHLIANTPDVGNVDEVLDVEVTGPSRDAIAFNVRLITDVLKVIDSEKVTLEFSGPLSPGVIRPVGGADYVYIIMPIRTTDTAA